MADPGARTDPAGAGPKERFVLLPEGRFRLLDWPGRPERPATILLHGLGGIADVWLPLVSHLAPWRGPVFAIDQRGHGGSVVPAGRGAFTARRMALDVLHLIDLLGLERPHLAGHSMGGRIAMVLGARFRERIRSVAVIDIGPEAWRANCEESVTALRERPARFASREEALAFAGRRRTLSAADQDLFMRRLEQVRDGSYRWRGDADAMARIVRTQRLRNYWRDWKALQPPALFVRGGRTREVRPEVAVRMRRLNGEVEFVEIAESSHNIPLIAPGRLADVLSAFWARAERPAGPR